ncbi:MAG: response regulator transcription factor [Anaerolineae bacterium]|nr:response regulator transcription factor [Anaerolineae bacterium]
MIMTISVLIVDDHAIVRQGLRLLLDAQPQIEVVGEAADGAMGVQMARALKPDVILMDLLMPGMDGIEAIRQLVPLNLPSRVLVLSSSLEDQLVKQALQAGAQGYILKASRSSELVQAIERVSQGLSMLDPAAAHVLMQQVQSNDPLQTLTPREREVFDGMARGLNNTEIANSLSVSEATVRTHVASILDKLTLRDRTQVTIYALKRGLIRLEDLD